MLGRLHAYCMHIPPDDDPFLFLFSDDMATNKEVDFEYTMQCPVHSLECFLLKETTSGGWVIFGVVMTDRLGYEGLSFPVQTIHGWNANEKF